MYSDARSLPSSSLQEIRVGGVAQIGFSGIMSGIDKQPVAGRLHVGPEGLAGDRQSESFHGGSEKAVLQYNTDHYAAWASEFPEIVGKFKPGGFGENFAVAGMSEATMCIGDFVRVGTALLQISESRQPCFKLNHRFGHQGISRRAQETGRTGWLYRVIEPGDVVPGDTISVVERPLPAWPVARLQKYLYDITDDLEMAEAISQLPHLSPGFRALFARRVENGKAENWEDRLSNGPLALHPTVWFEAEVAEVRNETTDVKSYRVKRVDGKPLASFSAGAHLDVKVNNGWTRSYSLCHLPREDGYRFAVRRADEGRGGSRHIHENWSLGDRLLVSEPRNHFELSASAQRHLFIAGGIGITPFLSMIEDLENRAEPWELHYLTREMERAPFAADLQVRFPWQVAVHATAGDPSRRVDLKELLSDVPLGTHVYCCGPNSLMTAVRDNTVDWPSGFVHFEAFSTARPKDLANCSSFEVRLAKSDRVLTVPEHSTLLDVLLDAGINVPSSCRGGTCGTCRVTYCEGTVDHQDMFLSREGRRTMMISCVSRGKSNLTLDI